MFIFLYYPFQMSNLEHNHIPLAPLTGNTAFVCIVPLSLSLFSALQQQRCSPISCTHDGRIPRGRPLSPSFEATFRGKGRVGNPTMQRPDNNRRFARYGASVSGNIRLLASHRHAILVAGAQQRMSRKGFLVSSGGGIFPGGAAGSPVARIELGDRCWSPAEGPFKTTGEALDYEGKA